MPVHLNTFVVARLSVILYCTIQYCMVFKTNFPCFLEKLICRCNLLCSDGGHFHCPFRGTTIIQKDTITTHLIECKNKRDMVQLSSTFLTTLTRNPPSCLSVNKHSCCLLPSIKKLQQIRKSQIYLFHPQLQPLRILLLQRTKYCATNPHEWPALPSCYVQR